MSDSSAEAGSRYEFQRKRSGGLPVVEVYDRNGARPKPLRIYPHKRGAGYRLPGDHKLPKFKGHFRTVEHVVDRFFELTEDEENRAQIADWVDARWAVNEADVAKDAQRWPLFILLVAAKLVFMYFFGWQWNLLPTIGMEGYVFADSFLKDALAILLFVGVVIVWWPPPAIPSRLRNTRWF